MSYKNVFCQLRITYQNFSQRPNMLEFEMILVKKKIMKANKIQKIIFLFKKMTFKYSQNSSS